MTRNTDVANLKIFDKGGATSFKGNDGKPETVEVAKGAAEKRLLCVVKRGSSGYRWFKNGRIIGVNTNMKKYRIKKYRYLKIKNIKINDQGVYVCQVHNSEDNCVNKTIYLNVVAGRSTISSSTAYGIWTLGQNASTSEIRVS